MLSFLRRGAATLAVDVVLSPPCPRAPEGVNPASARPFARLVAARSALLLAASLALAQPAGLPPRPSPALEAIVGEYGEGGARVVVRENGRALEVSTDGRTFERVRETGSDRYAGDHVEFRVDRGVPALPSAPPSTPGRKGAPRGKGGTTIVKGLSIGGAFLPRRDFGGEEGVFRTTPLRRVADLMKEAKAAAPPKEAGDFLPSHLVEVRSLDKSIALDVRYATTRNFLATPVYGKEQVMLQEPAAQALARAHRALKALGLGLMLHDGYRPWFVTWVFWNATPEASREFVADPAKGSKHNRGCAIDLTLFDLKTKQPLELTGLYDEMSPRSYPDYPGGTSRQRALRERLRRTMEAEGFTVYESEWWHFDYKDWPRYAIGNESWWK